jgi:ABC-type bacteriocin/lantibiotic exporter with double-glycine peptidase domain
MIKHTLDTSLEKENEYKEKSYKFFFNKFVKSQLHIIIILLALNIVSISFSFINPLLTKWLIDDVFIDKNINLFFYIIIGFFGMYFLSAASNYFSNYLTGKLELVMLKNVSESALNYIQRASIKNTHELKVGDLITRIIGNAQMAINIPVHIIPQIIISTISIVVPFIIMVYLNLQLALIVMSPILLFILSSLFFGKRMEKTQMTFLEENASVYSFLKEKLSIVPLIKVFGLEKWSQDKFNEKMDGYYNSSIKYTKASSLNISIGTLILGVPIILIMIFGSPMVIDGSLSLGTFTAFMSYVSIFFSPISTLSELWTSYKSSLPAFDRIKELFELQQDYSGNESLAIKKCEIEFNNVWFSYGNNKFLLKRFNAIFRKGLNYIVGDNGAGKSTILKLLCSLYSPDKGNIKIDGQNLLKVKKDDLVNNIAMIFSEPYLFDDSIYENIQIGNLSASKNEIINAAKLVNIHEFVKSLPDEYETQVGESGINLSSGEKQKIALARAILKNSPIILLDEVTKSIDTESKETINKVINELKNNKTIIIITHNANEIEPDSNIVYLGHKNHRKELISVVNNKEKVILDFN